MTSVDPGQLANPLTMIRVNTVRQQATKTYWILSVNFLDVSNEEYIYLIRMLFEQRRAKTSLTTIVDLDLPAYLFSLIKAYCSL